MNDKIAPNIIDNSPNRELFRVLKDQLKKSKDFPENYEKIKSHKWVKVIEGKSV